MGHCAYRVIDRGAYHGFDEFQAPQFFADGIAQRLTEPDSLGGDKRFAMCCGLCLRVCVALTTFLPIPLRPPTACGAAALVRRCRWKCESRRKMDSYEQCAVAREPVADPDAWMSASWGNGGLKHMIVCSLKRPSLGRRRCLSSAPTLRTA